MRFEVKLEPSKTYVGIKNLEKAVDKIPIDEVTNEPYRYFVSWTKDGRCFPVFLGSDAIHLAHQGHCVIVAS